MSESRPGERESVAKWLAVAVLGAAGILGVAWSVTMRPVSVPSPMSPSPSSTPAQPAADHRIAASPPASPVTSSPATQPQEEEVPGDVAVAPAPIEPPQEQPTVPRLININTATAAEFELLPGIGPTLAQRIVDDREANGKFKDVNDLDRVRGIGPRTVDRLRDLVTAN